MSDSEFLGRWIDLAAHVLTQPADHDPMREICDELSHRYAASATGTIDFSERRVRIGLYRFAADPAPYAPRVGDHPLALHYRSTRDPHARALADARRFADDRWSRTLLEALRADDLVDFVFVPLTPRPGMDHRWLGLSASAGLGPSARDELERLRPLIRAIDAQSRALAECRADLASAGRPAPVEVSARELAVLALLAHGLTAWAIASELGISPRTVSKHQQNLYRKLDVQDRLSAVLRGQELGMLRTPEPPARITAARFVEAAVARHGHGPRRVPASPPRSEVA